MQTGHTRRRIFEDVYRDLQSEARVREEYIDLIVPKQSMFFRGWVERGRLRSDTNVVNHVPIAHSIWAACVPPKIRFPSNDLTPNFWTLLVGPAFKGHKTWSITNGQNMLLEVSPERVETEIASPQALGERIVQQGQLCLFQPEFADFLSASARPSSFQHGARQMLTRVFDSPRNFHQRTKEAQKRRKKGDVTAGRVQHNPRVSLAAGITPSYLERYTTLSDWTGGFLSRFCVIFTNPEREWSMAQPEPEGWWEALQKYLQSFIALNPGEIGPCLGFDAAAAAYWEEWYNDAPSLAEGQRAAAVLRRGWELIPIKAAMNYALDRLFASVEAGDADKTTLAEPWYVTIDDLIPAAHLAEIHAASAMFLARNVSDTPDGRLMRRILDAIPPEGATVQDLLRSADVGRRKVYELIVTLQERSDLEKRRVADGGERWFRKEQTGGGEVVPLNVDMFGDETAVFSNTPDPASNFTVDPTTGTETFSPDNFSDLSDPIAESIWPGE